MSLLSGSVRSAGDARPMDVAIVDTAGNQLSGFDSSRPANAAQAELTFTAVAQVLFAANAARRKVYIVNATNKTLRVSLGSPATLTNFAFEVPVGQSYSSDLDDFTGLVSGILVGAPSGTNKVYVCEVTT